MALLAASILLATLSFAWRRITARSPLLTLHHLSSNSAASDEEQGLLTDVASSAAAADSETTDTGRRSQASRPNRLVSPNNFTGLTTTVCVSILSYDTIQHNTLLNVDFKTALNSHRFPLHEYKDKKKPGPESEGCLFHLFLSLPFPFLFPVCFPFLNNLSFPCPAFLKAAIR